MCVMYRFEYMSYFELLYTARTHIKAVQVLKHLPFVKKRVLENIKQVRTV